MTSGRPPLRSASPTTSPPFDGGEEMREAAKRDAIPLDGEPVNRSRRKTGTTARARDLRQRDNRAEALPWLELKRRKLGGHKFTRQLPIGPYFADFACREERLVVELDGSRHADNSYDRRRDEFMRSRGYSILRLWTTDVVTHRASVCESIPAALNGRLAEDVCAADLRYVHAASTAAPDSVSSPTDPSS